MSKLAESRRKLAETIEAEDDRDQGVNHNIPAILYRDAREMDRLQAHIDALEGQEARKLIALSDLLTAAENLMVEDGASDNGLCHRGLVTREECPHCRRWDALRTAIKKARGI